MKMIHLKSKEKITFREGCERYLDDCRARNLRDGTIGHYRQSYTQFFKYFNPDMLIEELSEKKYNEYVVYLRETLKRDSSIRLCQVFFAHLKRNSSCRGHQNGYFQISRVKKALLSPDSHRR